MEVYTGIYKTAETGSETRARSARVSKVSKVLCIPAYTDTAWYKVFMPCRYTARARTRAIAPGRVITVLYALRARASRIRRTSKRLTRDALCVTRTTVIPRLRGRKRAQTQARTRAPWLRVIAVLSAPRAWIRRAHTTRKRRTRDALRVIRTRLVPEATTRKACTNTHGLQRSNKWLQRSNK